MTNCKDCQAYKPIQWTHQRRSFGNCHLNPPTILPVLEGLVSYSSIQYKYPIVNDNDWCLHAVPVPVTDSQTNKE